LVGDHVGQGIGKPVGRKVVVGANVGIVVSGGVIVGLVVTGPDDGDTRVDDRNTVTTGAFVRLILEIGEAVVIVWTGTCVDGIFTDSIDDGRNDTGVVMDGNSTDGDTNGGAVTGDATGFALGNKVVGVAKEVVGGLLECACTGTGNDGIGRGTGGTVNPGLGSVVTKIGADVGGDVGGRVGGNVRGVSGGVGAIVDNIDADFDCESIRTGRDVGDIVG